MHSGDSVLFLEFLIHFWCTQRIRVSFPRISFTSVWALWWKLSRRKISYKVNCLLYFLLRNMLTQTKKRFVNLVHVIDMMIWLARYTFIIPLFALIVSFAYWLVRNGQRPACNIDTFYVWSTFKLSIRQNFRRQTVFRQNVRVTASVEQGAKVLLTT